MKIIVLFLILLCSTINGMKFSLRKTSFDSKNKMAVNAFLTMQNLFNGIIPNNTVVDGPIQVDESKQQDDIKDTKIEQNNSTIINGPLIKDQKDEIHQDEKMLDQDKSIIDGPISNSDQNKYKPLKEDDPIQKIINPENQLNEQNNEVIDPIQKLINPDELQKKVDIKDKTDVQNGLVEQFGQIYF